MAVADIDERGRKKQTVIAVTFEPKPRRRRHPSLDPLQVSPPLPVQWPRHVSRVTCIIQGHTTLKRSDASVSASGTTGRL